jgi:putative inorganic carbon (hco3(-)) transporter
VLLCNSRGTFVALILGVIVFLVTTRGPARKKVFRGFALGVVAVFLLLRDPEIVDRFMTVFASEEERDDSAAGRLVIWGVAATVLGDHPFGSGGDGFNRVYSRQYLETGRSVHNGFLSEAVEWGVQGLVLKLMFLLAGVSMVARTAWRPGAYNAESMVLASCLITSTAILIVASLFADFLDNEWGYWLVGLMLGYARAYGPPAQSTRRA